MQFYIQDFYIEQIYRLTHDMVDAFTLHVRRLVVKVICEEIGFAQGLRECTPKQEVCLINCATHFVSFV
jgi:hypothetical protein